MKYNWINAAAYEVTNVLIDLQPKLEQNKWIKLIRSHCFFDWVEWKTERTMEHVDSQVAKLQQEMQEHDEKLYVKPIIIEHEPDGSEAQKLLGGELQIKAPWLDSSRQDWSQLNFSEPVHLYHPTDEKSTITRRSIP